MKTWIVKFAYSGSSSREFFDKEFTCIDINNEIAEYVKSQNKGEAKSDRIRYWSKKPRETQAVNAFDQF